MCRNSYHPSLLAKKVYKEFSLFYPFKSSNKKKRCVMTNVVIPRNNLFCPNRFGPTEICYDGESFIILQDGNQSTVQQWDLSKELRGISTEKLTKCLECSYLALGKIGDDFTLNLNVRGLGGGPI